MELTPEAENYLKYLNQHISCVAKAYNHLKIIIPDLFDGFSDEVIKLTEEHIKEHDSIKFDPERLRIYGEHFLNKYDKDEYNKLIWEHIQKCPHHFQHWLIFYTPQRIEALEIPYDYIIEMICDWYSFSFIKNDETEIVLWYKKYRNSMIFAPKTQIIIDNIIDKIQKYLEANGKL